MEALDDGAVYTRGGRKMKVLKQHEFDHARMSMAVVMLVDDEVHIFVKGSFEAIKRLSAPGSVPADYSETARIRKQHAHNTHTCMYIHEHLRTHA